MVKNAKHLSFRVGVLIHYPYMVETLWWVVFWHYIAQREAPKISNEHLRELGKNKETFAGKKRVIVGIRQVLNLSDNPNFHNLSDIAIENIIQKSTHCFWVEGYDFNASEIARNKPCTCGSGLKMKKCCLL